MTSQKTLLFATCFALASTVTVAHAQSTSGGITGEAVAGDTVFVMNNDTGFKREVAITKDGKYQIRNMPVGSYQIVHKHADGSFEPSQQLDVRTGAMSRAKPPEPAAATKPAQ